MKKLLSTAILILAFTLLTHAEPGGTYVLTGNETSIDEIVKVDMQKFPDYYEGENLKFYVAKFKSENNIGKRKLVPGDQLTFPVTTASVEVKKNAFRQKLIGTWKTQAGDETKFTIVTEYKADGTLLTDFGGAHTFVGTWSIEGEYLNFEVSRIRSDKGDMTKSVTQKPLKIIELTESELKVTRKNEKLVTWKKMK